LPSPEKNLLLFEPILNKNFTFAIQGKIKMWDITDKVCLITGGTSGIGRWTAKELSRLGACVVITYRNEQKALETQKWIAAETGRQVETYYCDLSSFDSIRSFVIEFKTRYTRLDVLINNAGIWETRRKLSKDGIELNFATNHLGPFLLTNLLLETIKKSGPARIINVASGAHQSAKIGFDDIEMKKDFSGYKAYGQSKLANILFTKHLSEMVGGLGITVNCLHPGVVSTNIFKNMGKIGVIMMKPFMITPEKGAQTSVYLATSEDVSNISGKYFSEKKVVNSSAISQDKEAAQKLWDLSSKYVGWKG
jgi:NAD(P)-dependent dehydrogenase (short-subunit alcohol dehydrogenase family)